MEVELVDFTEGMFLSETQEGVSLDEVMEKTCVKGMAKRLLLKGREVTLLISVRVEIDFKKEKLFATLRRRAFSFFLS